MKRGRLAGLLAAALVQGAAAAEPQAVIDRGGLAWFLDGAHGDAVLRVVDEQGAMREFTLGAPLRWSPRAAGLGDGRYRYELTVAPPGVPADRRRAPDSRGRPGGALASGDFALRNGALVTPGSEAAEAKRAAVHSKDQITADDLIVQGGMAIGLDAAADAPFGALSMYFTENNLRIHFEDTSAPAQPDADWEITANDSAAFAASAFSVMQRNTDPPRHTLRMLAAAPAGSLWLDDDGRLGLNVRAAQQRLQVGSGDEAGLRLAQDNTGGFVPSTWDIVADETGLRVADALAATTPFHVAAGAPTGTLTVHESRRVGIGTPEPQATLHVRRSDGSTRVRVEDASADSAPRMLAQLLTPGTPVLLLQGEAAGWTLRGETALAIATTAPAGGALQLAANGDLSISGTLSQGSSRALKHAIEAAAPAALLERVRALPLYAWQYTGDALDARHLGPMAEDVHAAFGLGGSERALAPGDVAAIAMAAAQALREELAARDAELDVLLARLERLESAGGAR